MGYGLPGFQPVVEPSAIGSVPPNFPATMAALEEMTHQALSNLAAFYNCDFNVVAADNVNVRRDKFLDFICNM